MTWVQICRELSIVKETVRQSHFLGRGDSRFFQVAGNHLIINYPCLSPGNYPSYQTSNGREWCTDPQTGWRVAFNFFRLIYIPIFSHCAIVNTKMIFLCAVRCQMLWTPRRNAAWTLQDFLLLTSGAPRYCHFPLAFCLFLSLLGLGSHY